jgi:hypothetical protein
MASAWGTEEPRLGDVSRLGFCLGMVSYYSDMSGWVWRLEYGGYYCLLATSEKDRVRARKHDESI